MDKIYKFKSDNNTPSIIRGKEFVLLQELPDAYYINIVGEPKNRLLEKSFWDSCVLEHKQPVQGNSKLIFNFLR